MSWFVNPWYRNPNICTDHTDGLTALPLGSQGPRTKDRWPRTKDQGPRTKDHGPWDQGPRTKDQGSRIKDQGPRTKDQGPRTKDHGPRTKQQGPRTKDHGPCFGTTCHPRRYTDVRLRLSKSTIEDRSFYICFTMELLVKMMVYDENDFCMKFYDLFSDLLFRSGDHLGAF